MRLCIALLAAVILLSGCTADIVSYHEVEIMELEVKSIFEESGLIPGKFTCNGEDISPPIEINLIPAETKSLVLIMDDPDAPDGTFTHWIMWNIPSSGKIDENHAPGTQGKNDAGEAKYKGPCPPTGEHRYFFRIYALDQNLELQEGASRKELEAAMEGKVIAQGQLMGKFGR
jgi:Raf kinase inhibitor-like YbhB/YbcL family protein